MSHFECPLNRRFRRSKKVVQVVQIGGGGGGSPLAQKAKLGFKLLLLERLNENLKQKHF